MKHENAVFEVEMTNNAWGRTHSGYYINVEGNVYRYDYSDFRLEPEHERIGEVPLSVLSEKAALIEEAGRGEFVETGQIVYDAGSTHYLGYLFNPETQTRQGGVLLFADDSGVIRKNTSSAAKALTEWLQSVLEQFNSEYKPRDNRSVDEKVADVLNLIATKPNLRYRPLEGDLQGNFTQWFDGGAVLELTGTTRYRFADGTSASTSLFLQNIIIITLSDGTEISVPKETARKSIGDSPKQSNSETPTFVPTIPPPATNLTHRIIKAILGIFRQTISPFVINSTSKNAKLGTRPKIWYCLFCGYLGGSAENNNMCQNCKAERPVFDDGITFSNCLNCRQFNPLFALFCEWCGEKLRRQY